MGSPNGVFPQNGVFKEITVDDVIVVCFRPCTMRFPTQQLTSHSSPGPMRLLLKMKMLQLGLTFRMVVLSLAKQSCMVNICCGMDG